VRDPAKGINRSPNGFGGPPSHHGANFAMADGSVRFISEKASPAVMRALATPNAGDKVDESVLENPR
jgi:prepilin-type processing-associated H-X9-DG protein